MAFPWSNKRDSEGAGPPQLPTAAEHDEALEFEQLTGQLEQLRESFNQANERIAAYLIRRESQAAAAPSVALDVDAIQARLDAVAEKIIDRLAAATARPAPAATESPGLGESAVRSLLQPILRMLEGIDRQSAASSQALRQLQEQTDQGMQHLAELLSPPQEAPVEAPPTVSSSDWERAILGRDLAADPVLAFQRQQLLDGVLDGNLAALALAGQLLIFQSSPDERLPQLLKDIGEAYYRWQPKISHGTSPMEEALVAWLQKTCKAAEINNVIELVHPGERFDSSRHVSSTRGVEISEVLGWIVLRDNGKVYTKANVVVR